MSGRTLAAFVFVIIVLTVIGSATGDLGQIAGALILLAFVFAFFSVSSWLLLSEFAPPSWLIVLLGALFTLAITASSH